MNVFIHSQAICESTDIGDGTRIWAFAHVLPGAKIGADCNICDGVFIEGRVTVGERVTIKCGVQLWDGVALGDDVFVGPNATFTNDPFPRSRRHPAAFPETSVADGASIGANATILPGLKIGRRAMVGAGAVVTHDVPANAIVVGNPARIVGYADSTAEAEHLPSSPPTGDPVASHVPGVHLIPVTHAKDLRGGLVAIEHGNNLPFRPRRSFVVLDVPSNDVRGSHAHKECAQLLVCLVGSVHALVDDGHSRQEFVLDKPDYALFVPPMIWGTQYRYSADAVLMVLASHPYDDRDYIRDYDEFLSKSGNGS